MRSDPKLKAESIDMVRQNVQECCTKESTENSGCTVCIFARYENMQRTIQQSPLETGNNERQVGVLNNPLCSGQYREASREQIQETNREHYANNPDIEQVRQRAEYQKNKDKMTESV